MRLRHHANTLYSSFLSSNVVGNSSFNTCWHAKPTTQSKWNFEEWRWVFCHFHSIFGYNCRQFAMFTVICVKWQGFFNRFELWIQSFASEVLNDQAKLLYWYLVIHDMILFYFKLLYKILFSRWNSIKSGFANYLKENA